jgi:hypothetical protein
MNLALVGDSHATAILKAAKSSQFPLCGGSLGGARRFLSPFFQDENGQLSFVPIVQNSYEIWISRSGERRITDFPNGVVCSLGMATAPFYGDKEWLSWTNRYCSEDVLVEVTSEIQRPVLDFYNYLLDRGLLRAVISCPPPQVLHRAVKLLGPTTVLRLHRIMQSPVRRMMLENSIPIIDVPAEDGQGFLRPEFCGPDTSHANELFGTKVIEALKAYAEPDHQSMQEIVPQML